MLVLVSASVFITLFYWFPPILGGNVCNQRCLSVCHSVILSVCLSFCLSVRNADISETIIARAAKFGMHNLHIKSAKFVEGIFKRCLRSRDIEF